MVEGPTIFKEFEKKNVVKILDNFLPTFCGIPVHVVSIHECKIGSPLEHVEVNRDIHHQHLIQVASNQTWVELNWSIKKNENSKYKKWKQNLQQFKKRLENVVFLYIGKWYHFTAKLPLDKESQSSEIKI